MKYVVFVYHLHMRKPFVILDTLLTFTTLFLLTAVVVGYFTRQTHIILTVSLCGTLGITYFTGKLAARKQIPKQRKQERKEKLQYFLFSPPQDAVDFVREALETKGAVDERDGLLIVKKTAFYVALTPEKVTVAVLARVFAAAKAQGVKRLVFLSAYGADDEATETASCLLSPQTEIWEWDKVYALLSYLHHTPTQTLKLQKPKKRKKLGTVMLLALRRENAKRYLFAAIVMLVFARFVAHGVLYIVFSAVCIVLALLSRLRIGERLSGKTAP